MDTPDPMALLQAQLAAQAQDNPAMAALMQMLQQRSAAPREAEPAADAADGDAAEHDEPARPRSLLVDELEADVESLHDELDELRERNDILAAALGACHLCFGDDRRCPVCRGRGGPGWQRPDATAFRRYVRPAVERLRPEHAAARPTEPSIPRRNAAPQMPASTEGLQASPA